MGYHNNGRAAKILNMVWTDYLLSAYVQVVSHSSSNSFFSLFLFSFHNWKCSFELLLLLTTMWKCMACKYWSLGVNMCLSICLCHSLRPPSLHPETPNAVQVVIENGWMLHPIDKCANTSCFWVTIYDPSAHTLMAFHVDGTSCCGAIVK